MSYRCLYAVLPLYLSLLSNMCLAAQTPLINDRRMEVTSPDGHYIAVIKLDTAAWVLSIYRRQATSGAQHGAGARQCGALTLCARDIGSDIAGARWAPHHGHLLVFAEGGVYADARMAIWQGGKRAVTLVPRRLKKDSGQEFYQLDGVSTDGKTVYYGYAVASEDKYGAHWRSYKIGLAQGSIPKRDNRNHGYHPPPVCDKAVMAYGH